MNSPFLSWFWFIPGGAGFQCQLAIPGMVHGLYILQLPLCLRTSARCLCSWTCSSLAIYLPAASPEENPVPGVLPFILRMGWVPALLGQPGGPPEHGDIVGRSESAIIWSEELWLPISGQLNRRLLLFYPMFGVFVTLKISMAAVYSHARCALHDSRESHLYKPRCGPCFQHCAGWWPCNLLAWSGPRSTECFYPSVCQTLVILITPLWICS